MRKMVYLPYVRFEQEEGEGRGWHGTECMPDYLGQVADTLYCAGGIPETERGSSAVSCKR